MESGLTQTTFDLVRQFGYLAVFVFLFLETSMLFPLLPSEVVVPFAAGVLVAGPAGIVLFGAASAGGAVVGGVVAYYAFGVGSDRFLHGVPDRFVDDDDVDRSEEWFSEYGEGSVLWGRLLPFLRSVISIPAGMARMDVAKFVVYTALGAFVFNGGVAAVVYWGKQQSLYHAVATYATSNPFQGALVAALVVVVSVVVWTADLSGVVGRYVG
jgi:membrane protein DedA with SNARE-associated domain